MLKIYHHKFILLLTSVISLTNGYLLTCYTPINSPNVSKIDPTIGCTHLLIIGDTTVDIDGLINFPSSENMKHYVQLKKKNPNLKIMITLTPNNSIMSQIVLNDKLMNQMANTLVNYMLENTIDGFDIDWEFPAWSSDAKKTDKKGLSRLLEILKNTFDNEKRKLLLFLTVGAPYTIAKKGYNIDAINKYVDYLQIMTYDFHEFRRLQPITGFNAPLRPAIYEYYILAKMNSDYSVKYWLKMGLLKEKMLFGIPTYGKGYTLLSKHLHFPYAPAVGISKFGNYIDYITVCNLTDYGYNYKYSKKAATPYWYKDYQWITAENKISVREKTQYAKDMKLGGVMVFSLLSDDYEGKCEQEKYPLIKIIYDQLYNNKNS